MSERKPPRRALIGLIAVALIGSAAFYFLSLIHIPSPRDGLLSRMPSSA